MAVAWLLTFFRHRLSRVVAVAANAEAALRTDVVQIEQGRFARVAHFAHARHRSLPAYLACD